MQLIIKNKDNYEKQFIYNYLPKYIKSLTLNSLDSKKLDNLDINFKINSKQIIEKILNNLNVNETWDSYVLYINKSKLYNGKNLNSWYNIITFGNRSCKGYPLLDNIIRFIADRIDIIYIKWKEKL